MSSALQGRVARWAVRRPGVRNVREWGPRVARGGPISRTQDASTLRLGER